ncbi:MAG: LamG-like jellyroll fold domain-containing protein [Solirubrobacterales bacterium]
MAPDQKPHGGSQSRRSAWSAFLFVGLAALTVSSFALTPGTASATEGPIAAYSFDEGSGETAHDSAGSHNATIEDAEWVGGKYGSALKFDGKESCVTVPSNSELDLSGDFTLEAWARPQSSQESAPVIFRETPTFYSYSLFLGASTSGRAEGFVANEPFSYSEVGSPEALPSGAWSHLALTNDGEHLRLYVNGELVDTSAARSAQTSSDPLEIGCSKNLGEYFEGLIDEVRIYDRVLSAEEINEDENTPVWTEFTASISGSATEGEALAAVPGTLPGSPHSTFNYQWQLCDEKGEECEELEGARRRSYVLGKEDLGHTLRVVIAVGPESINSVRSSPSEVVVERKPASKQPPGIFGHVAEGKTLSASGAEWSPIGAAVTYQWKRCNAKGESCEDIEGATEQDYVVQSADVGSTLKVASTATTTGGSTTAVSEATEVVPASALKNTAAPTITESAGETGTVLTAHAGTWSGEGEISYSYEWQRCNSKGAGCDAITDEDRSTYAIQGEDVGSKIRVVVTATNASAREAAASSITSLIEAGKPANAVAPSINGKPRANKALEGETGEWTGLGHDELSLQWELCDASGEECEGISGATESEFEPPTEDVGSTVRLKVTATNESGSTTGTSAATEPIASAAGPPPSVVTPPSITGETEVGEELTAEVGVWSGATEYEYQWERCDSSGQQCEPIAEAGEPTYVAGKEDVGAALRVRVTALAEDESAGYAFAVTDQSVRVAGGPASTEAPALEGGAKEGETISVTPGSWSGAEPITFSYKWQLCELGECSDIEGATSSSYKLSSEDDLHAVRAVVSAKNSAGTTTAVSAPTSSIGSLAPLDETSPTISGGAVVGDTLSATHGTWNGEPTIAYSYQWQRCDSAGASCKDISGEEGSSYELSSSDAGATIRVLVTASNSFGEAHASSDPSAPVSEASGPTLTAAPAISGTAEVEEALSVDHGKWEGAESYAYQWQRCGVETGRADCANIPGATAATYTPTYDDVGSVLQVAVTATGAGGTAVALSEATEEVQPSLEPGREADSLTNTAPPEISGEAEETQTLSASPGTWRSYPSVSFEYRWRRCNASGAQCADIVGATGSTYVLQSGDVGATVRVMVIASNGPRGRVVVSKPTGVVTQAKPTSISPPFTYTEWGEGIIDQEVLIAEVGEWGGSGLAFSYQWQLCNKEGKECEDLKEEANEERYEIRTDEIGSTLRVVVTASNEAGSASAPSEPTEVVAPGPPVSGWPPPEISGEALQDGSLEAYPGHWWGTPEIEFAYQWQRCNDAGEECNDIEGATKSTYVAQSADVGMTLRVVVTGTNVAGSSKATSEPSEVVGPPQLPTLEGAAPSIERASFNGRTFTSQPGEWSGHMPIEYGYQWQRCNEAGEECEGISGATSASYLTTAEDLGHTIRLKVMATNTSGSASEVSEASGPITTAMVSNVSAPVISGNNRPGSELTASPGEWSGSGLIEYAYQWQLCNKGGEECEEIEGATKPTYTVSPEDSRKSLRVLVTATGSLGSAIAESEALQIIPSPSENESPPTITGSLVVGETLTAGSGEWSPAPDEYLYQWQRCSFTGTGCFDLSGQTASTYTLTSADAGKTIRVTVTAQNEGDSEPPSVSSEVSEVVNTKAPSNLVAPTLSTTNPIAEEELSATAGTWIGVAPLSYSYEWQYCYSTSPGSCSYIPGATSLNYTPSNSYIGWRLRLQVHASNSNGSEWAASSISQPVKKGPPHAPHNLTPPTIAGHPVPGSSVYVYGGSWSEVSTWAYEWRRCNEKGEACAAIAGANRETYDPVAADIGHTLRVVVTGKNSLGEAAVTTEPSEVVTAATRPENEVAPAIEETAEVGKTIYANEGEWSGSPDIEFDYIWKRCDGEGRSCSVIANAGRSSYRLKRADAGGTIRLQVTATNGWGSVTATSAPTAVVPAPPPVANVELPTMWPWWNSPKFGAVFEARRLGEWEGEPEVAYQWQRCDPLTEEPEAEPPTIECSDIPEATDAKHYVPQAGDVGFKLRLKEVGSAGEESETVYSKPTSEVVTAKVSEKGASYTGPAVPGSTLTVKSGVESQAELPITTDYKFLRLNEGGSPEELQDGSSPEYKITEEDLGHKIEVEMTVSIWRLDNAEVLDTRHINLTTAEVEGPPENEVPPSISGESAVGASLSAEAGKWHGGGGPLTYAFQWQRCDEEGKGCSDISGATKSSYLLTKGDIGSTLRVQVTASNGSFEEVATSTPSSVITSAVVPTSEEAPSISGTAIELGTVEATPGTWSGTEPLSYTYQWQGCEPDSASDCLDIEGATGSSLSLDATEVGQWLRVLVTATNAGGSTTSASELVGPVEHAPPPALVDPPSLAVLGPPSVGSTLMTDGGTWENAPASDLGYQWLRCDSEGEECEEIEGAEAESYQLGSEDIGLTLKVEVTAENSSGQVTAMSELSPEIGKSTGSAEGKMAYLAPTRNRVFLSELEGGAPEEIASCDSLVGSNECTLYSPRISPNGKLVAVEVRDTGVKVGEGLILVMNFDGTGVRTFAKGSEPVWSGDGTELIFTADNPKYSGSTRIVSARADGSNAAEPQSLIETSGTEQAPDVSPDEETIVYAARESGGGASEIYLSGTVGSTPTRLELGPEIAEAFDPRFSPNGEEIIFRATPARPQVLHFGEEEPTFEGSRLWAINRNGTDLHPIVPGELATYGRPDVSGSDILVSRESATWISFGSGGTFQYSEPVIWRLSREGSTPHALPLPGIEPDYFEPHGVTPPPVVRECPRHVRDCKPWDSHARARSAEYALKWSEEPKRVGHRLVAGPYFANNAEFWHSGNNCTNFVSQAWHAAGQRFIDQFERNNPHYPLSWWAHRNDETEAMSKENYTWYEVQGFREEQVHSGRAIEAPRYPASDWRVGDVVLLNWKHDEEDKEYNHAMIVTGSNANGRFLSAETANRNNVSWSEEVGNISRFLERNHEEYPSGWTWLVLRPTYMAASIPSTRP